jgi:2,3-bisphosphoglycerate-independent phosphoglycerate mutase
MCSDSKTKYLILVPDGMSDVITADPSVDTCLKIARTPWMDKMASAGLIGLTRTVPEGMSPGSDVANLSIMGYSPSKSYTGRAPFEAASMGVALESNDVAFRLNLVTLDRNFTVMADHSADHITTQEANALSGALAPVMESFGLMLFPGISYRNLLVWPEGPDDCVTHPPHDFPGDLLAGKLPSGPGSDVLLRIIIKSWKVLDNHPVNQRRIKRCQGPANSVWPWGQGKPPKIRTVTQRFGITGTVVAAVDLVRGIGKYAGLEVVDVPGATGYLDTNYQGKVDAALNALKTHDFAFLHVEAPDEAGHSGQVDLKVKAIEDFDEKIVAPVMTGLQEFPSWRVLLMPDHCTPVGTRIHSAEPVPFVLVDSGQWDPSRDATHGFSEQEAAVSGRAVEDASKMVEILLGQETLA